MDKNEHEKNTELSQSDVTHIRGNFLNMNDVMEKSGVTHEVITKWLDRGEFPEPTYLTQDGVLWYPPYLVILVQRSLRNDTNPKYEFLLDAKKVLEKPGYVYRFGQVEKTGTDDEDAEKMWDDFKSGLYGACLRKPDPKSIMAKGSLIKTIKELLANPDPENVEWCEKLRKTVNELDSVEAQFTDFDRKRFGGTVSRDVYITSIKKQYSHIFTEKNNIR
jgi:predicted DNA-binding transcriptional regulator AlpA